MQNSNQASVQNSSFDWIIALFRCQACVRIWVVSYLIERASRLAKRTIERKKITIDFAQKNNRKYDTIQPMKYSVQQEVQTYPRI